LATREAWEAIYVGDAKVGHLHLAIKPVKDSRGRELVNVRLDYEMTFQRGNDRSSIKLLYGTIETQEGEVLRLDTRTQASGQDIRTYGDVIEGKINLILEAGGRKSQQEIAWGPDVRGPYGAEMSLSRQPLAPGEARDVKTFVPDLNKVCLTRLKAIEYEDVPLGPDATTHRLLRIESSVANLDGSPIPTLESTLWVDATGQIMKTRTNLLGGMFTYRTTKAGATSKSGSAFRLLEASILKVPQPIPNAEQSRAIVYRVKGKNLERLFPQDQRQTLNVVSDGIGRLEVRSDSPDTGEPGPADVEPEYLEANPLVDSADSEVRKHTRTAIGRREDPWEKAKAIEDWVFHKLERKNFSTAFAPAAEVARKLSGDCTEHGVLTAAMCRAAGIPARCVVGFVYADNLNGFGPHMWNEVYVNGRWVAIDSTFNQSQVDATHLKLAASSLKGVAPFEAFLPVLEAMQDLSIEAVEIR
jgi:hypothetical protein